MSAVRILATGALSATGVVVSADVRHTANAACGVQIVGSMTATLVVEASMNGVDFDPYAVIVCASGAIAATITAPGSYRTELVGPVKVRVRCASYTAGSPAVSLMVLEN